MNVLLSIFAIFLMIVLHELGHFIAGKICKIPVYEFAIGMGPKICSFKRKETTYSLRLFPIGGYCAFDDIEQVESSKSGIMDYALDKLSPLKRIFICAAGPFMNIFTAFIIAFIIFINAGTAIVTTEVASVNENSPVYSILQEGDIITEINNIDIKDNQEQLVKEINKNGNNEIELKYIRENKEEIIKFKPYFNEQENRYMIGVTQKIEYRGETFFNSLTGALKQTWYYISTVYQGLFYLITGKYSLNEASGIVGTVSTMSEYANQKNFFIFLEIAAFISANLGVMNLLPIPALDGSKMISSIYEMITKKNINKKIVEKATIISFACLLIFSFVMIFIDVFRIIT